jgi:glycosyltransferase involved in cell wall biosynthesis
VDYLWALRKALGQRLPLPLRRRVMGVYHRFFWYVNQAADLAAMSLDWRGQQPRVYFPRYKAALHPTWRFYVTHPPLRYAPYPIAQLCHWVNYAPERPARPYIAECEHILALGGDITNWQTGLQNLDRINRLVAQEECRYVFTYSEGLVQHSRRYLRPELWPKLGAIPQVFPAQPEHPRPAERPFTILMIASRFSDKGVPEAVDAFRALRDRHGEEVRLLLVSQALPPGYRLPEGVMHHDTPRMSDQLKQQVFRASHVLLIPCYSDTTVPIIEACAYGVPTVTTRIHHGEEFVQDGITGYLIEPPVYSYSEHYGVRWKLWEDFLADLDVLRARGDLKTVVEQTVDRLEAMISGRADLTAMGRAARARHAAKFAPEVRNARLLHIYQAALDFTPDVIE